MFSGTRMKFKTILRLTTSLEVEKSMHRKNCRYLRNGRNNIKFCFDVIIINKYSMSMRMLKLENKMSLAALLTYCYGCIAHDL